MSGIKAYWFFAQGLSRSIYVPTGTMEKIRQHVEWVEESLGIEREKYLENPVRWKTGYRYEGIDDKTLCDVASDHNRWQKQLFEDFGKWSENQPGEGFEEITPSDAEYFFPALQEIHVPIQRWSRDFYKERMDVYYEALRGRESEGISLGCRPLNIKQANAVIWLFSHILDEHDTRLEVPNGCDHLEASDDGGYDWCEKCGAVLPEDASWCKKRKCPLRENYH